MRSFEAMANGALPSPHDPRDYKAEAVMSGPDELPDKIDYGNRYLDARNQGSRPICAAMAASAVKEGQENDGRYMSPEFLWSFTPSTNGMTGRYAMNLLLKKGCLVDASMPLGTPRKPSGKECIEASKYRIKSYAAIDTISGMKKALAVSGPCMIVVPQYDCSTTFWRANGQPVRGGHALTVIGYDEGGFILRNSWGASWGDKGCTRFPYSDWGMQWEAWTSVDDPRNVPAIPVEKSDEPTGIRKLLGRVRDFFKKLLGRDD